MNAYQEEELRSELRRRAAEIQVGPVPARLLTAQARQRRPKGRRRVGVLTIVVTMTLVAAVLVGPMLLGRMDPALSGDWATRGSLAEDEDYLAQVRRWFARTTGDATPEDVQVLYAGDVGHHRLAMAAIAITAGGEHRLTYRGLSGPAGSSDRLAVEVELAVDGAPGEASMVVGRLYDDEEVTLVGLAAPDTEVLQVSRQPQLHADGTASRKWADLPDEDPEEGVFEAVLDDDMPGGTRVRAINDGEVVGDRRFDRLTQSIVADDRLQALVADAADGRAVGRLAVALAEIEAYVVGPDSITSVEVLWTSEKREFMVGAVARTANGAALEMIFSDDPDATGNRLDYSPALRRLRHVPAETAGTEPIVWRGYCEVVGWAVPDGPEVASVELIADGKVLPRVETTGRPLVADYSAVADECDFEGLIVVRTYDAAGRPAWSAELPSDGDYYAMVGYPHLDIPSTVGEQVR